ncbi:thiolase family protein [Desulfoscipio gibsoniae]|uniref:propanoyl-CoA C-acyltransferase n=1 Tax=Desulfoscipio gibsoniae DSM 7213 TaxID=767817 RepID=R4KHU0_9FIRM|nr:thiolase family protein [Desulfoscipio gibsoniae]AGL00070.1 acetyl-CoA acetyltransferase [Desulfoscipio gibsoniae DSM 7213]
MRNVCVIAGGQCQWGVRQATERDLFQEAGKACFEDNKIITNKDIDGLIVGSAFTERCSFQTHLAPLVAEHLGIKPKNICARVELLCATGSTGIIMAAALIKSGEADVVMVIGGEKLYTPQRWEVNYTALAASDHDFDTGMGLGLPPPAFAAVAKQHMKLYGTTEEQLAMVSIKNRRNGLNNSKGQYKEEITLEVAMNARAIVRPLKLFDCCPVTDGAAAIILAAEEKAKYLTDKPLVYFRGSAQASLHNMSANMPSWTTWEALKIAAQQAYNKARVTPQDIDVAQTHDCFTISEIIEYEDLGFCQKGEGGWFIEEGKSDFGGQVPVNTDGGLLSSGHPFGATGIRQGIEIIRQLRGDAVRQVEGARIGLTHNLSGLMAAHTVLIYGRDLE